MIDLYTDGACKNNPGPGGWGVYITNLPPELLTSNYDKWVKTYKEVNKDSQSISIQSNKIINTTNNQMELQAAIEACNFCKQYQISSANIYTDSTYVFKGITEWIIKWKKTNRLCTSSPKAVKNIPYWLELSELNQPNFKWIWVKGHSNNIGNNIADYLATTALLRNN